MTLTTRLASRSLRHGRVLALTSLLALGAAASVACGGSSHSDNGNPSRGSGAEAGQGADDSVGGTTGQTGGTTGARGGSGATSGKGGSTSGSGAADGSGATGGSDAAAGAGDGVTGGSTGFAGDASTGGYPGLPPLGSTQCSDGMDNDGDGLVDGLDPECTGPWDNDEGSFATGIPGDNSDPKWQDCFFDGNSGAGDDGCRYATGCLTGELSQDDKSCSVTQQCIDKCGAAAPNGCDCFGCCTVQRADGSTVDVFEATTCSLDNIDDEDACPRCSKSTLCENPCGECELCPGKTVADLPASCTPPDTGTGGTSGAGGSGGTGGSDATGGTAGDATGGTGGDAMGGTGGSPPPPPPPTYTCDGGQQVCGAGLPACPAGLYCSLGCCTVLVR
jgi:hypothetical protein